MTDPCQRRAMAEPGHHEIAGWPNVALGAARRVVTEKLRTKKTCPANQNVEVAEKDEYTKGSNLNPSSQHFGALPLARHVNAHISLACNLFMRSFSVTIRRSAISATFDQPTISWRPGSAIITNRTGLSISMYSERNGRGHQLTRCLPPIKRPLITKMDDPRLILLPFLQKIFLVLVGRNAQYCWSNGSKQTTCRRKTFLRMCLI